jgi:hypothetical protein
VAVGRLCFVNAPVISHEKDWGMVDPVTAAAITKERQKRYPGFNAGKKRKKKSNCPSFDQDIARGVESAKSVWPLRR